MESELLVIQFIEKSNSPAFTRLLCKYLYELGVKNGIKLKKVPGLEVCDNKVLHSCGFEAFVFERQQKLGIICPNCALINEDVEDISKQISSGGDGILEEDQ
jgi:hypothetical protein